MNGNYGISALSQQSGVNLETIRYYERIGLLAAPPRSSAGYRRYDEAAVKRLRFIRRGRELGFGIEDIRSLLQLSDQPEQSCAKADQLAQTQLAEIEAKIADLQALRVVLQGLIGCHSQNAEHCLLLEALQQRQCCLPAQPSSL